MPTRPVKAKVSRPALMESIEPRQLLATTPFAVKVNFQPQGTATVSGYQADYGYTYAARGNGFTYGWSADNRANARDRNNTRSPNQAYDTFNCITTGGNTLKWELSVPSGTYSVRVIAGDPSYDMGPGISAEGITVVNGKTSSSNRWLDGTRSVTVSDGKLTLTGVNAASRNAINWVEVTQVTDPVAEVNWPSVSEWHTVTLSPIPRFEAHGVSYAGKLYLFGGWIDSSFNSTTRVDVYDPAKNTWTRLKDMAAPETHAGTALDEKNGILYWVAGHRGKYPSVPSDEVWTYKFSTDTWTKLNVTLPQKMGANTCQIVNGKLHSFGGNEADRRTNTDKHYVLDLANIGDGFTEAAPLPSPRDHMTSFVINGSIYAVGGEFGHDIIHDQQKILQRYDEKTDTWIRLADCPIAKSHAESSIFELNGKIIWAGGQIEPQAPTDNVVQYDPATNKWTTLAPLPAKRQGTTVQLVGDYFVFSIGGYATSQPQRTTWVAHV